MITAERLREIAFWSAELSEEEIERARRGVSEKSFAKGAYICHKGDRMEAWTGVISGLVRLGTVSQKGKAITLAGMRAGIWFGEGSVLKNEPRQYDLVALREVRLAMMNMGTFFWLFEHSAGFNRFLVRQFNERIGQFIALVEFDRSLDATARVARNIAWLCNPVLVPKADNQLDITQEEIGLISGVSRQAANGALQALEQKKLLRVGHGGITVLNLEKLSRYED
ncbi:MAG TPA: Crp/Fnr family transcriptional regulator [Xanthobacteraceae bacterium]|nr:Crp/Fnr family transcriptional regulator [Xanthobacteraceae bacterium]